MHTRPSSLHASHAFTLIELLTVIAIIGILAAIIIPTTGAVRKAAKKAQTKTQFSQWTQSMLGYKNEYGFFPPVNRTIANYDATSGSVNRLNSDAFAAALTGKNLDGTAITGTTTKAVFGNKKRQVFYSIAESDLNTARTALVDAFGNTDIVVIYDRDGDGMITNNDFDTGSSLPTVTPIAGSALTPAPITNVAATTGPRASVIFYSAGAGDAAKDIIYSWE
jgi:prepilin-type N-terminal cleavage/methylation domain-containing protein